MYSYPSPYTFMNSVSTFILDVSSRVLRMVESTQGCRARPWRRGAMIDLLCIGGGCFVRAVQVSPGTWKKFVEHEDAD